MPDNQPVNMRTTDRVTRCNVCSVQWGGGVLSTMGVFSTVWVFSTLGDIMSTVRGYLEYCGDVQHHGGYHEYHRGIP